VNRSAPSRTERHTYEARFASTAALAGVPKIDDPMF
jgi:hypothetical protein